MNERNTITKDWFSRWFGTEKWSRTHYLCADPDERIDTPSGTKCLECGKPIKDNDRGVITECGQGVWGHWDLQVDDKTFPVCSYHLYCFLAACENGKPGKEITDRINFVGDPVPVGVEQEVIEEANLQIGRGWKK